MPHFHIAYWALHAAPWRVFKKVEAKSAREAIERAAPQAAGRYRVTVDGSGQTAGLFRISVRDGRCELREVNAFDRESVDQSDDDPFSVQIGRVAEGSKQFSTRRWSHD